MLYIHIYTKIKSPEMQSTSPPPPPSKYKSQLLETLKTYYKQTTPSIIQTSSRHYLSQKQLQVFKTKECQFLHLHYHNKNKSNDHINHQFNHNHRILQAPYYFNCQYYHSDKDRRRRCVMEDGKLGYQAVFYGHVGNHVCSNWLEYLYHPHIYKTIQCIVPTCSKKYCPKLHIGQKPTKVSSPSSCIAESPTNTLAQQIKQLNQLRNGNMINLQEQTKSCYKTTQTKILQYVHQLHTGQEQQHKKQEQLQRQIKNLALQTSQKTKENGTSSRNSQSLPNTKYKLKDQHSTTATVTNGKDKDYDRLFFMEHLNIVQDRTHQFKMFKDKDPRRVAAIVLEYISAFLNSDGGSIYLGVNDQSVVHGLDVTQKWLDQFKLAIDSDGRFHMNPPLIPQKYDLRIIPVSHQKKIQLVVIQIKVFPQSESQKKVLTLYKKQCYLRMNASNHRLSASDIIQYMRLMNTKKQQTLNPQLLILESPEQKLSSMSMKQLKQMQQYINKISHKVGTVMKKKEVGGIVVTSRREGKDGKDGKDGKGDCSGEESDEEN